MSKKRPHDAWDAAGGRRPFDDLDEGNLNILDAFFHELALEASNDPTPNTPEEQAEDDGLMAWAERLMATPPRAPK